VSQISSPEHRVVESKPDSAVADLRFHAPWPQLQALAESVDLAKLDDIEHKHVPYGVCEMAASADCMYVIAASA
jgi:NEDD8-activating enzyme E1 regulatory subunit